MFTDYEQPPAIVAKAEEPPAIVAVKTSPKLSSVKKVVPVVTTPKQPFQSGSYHAGHYCPNCGKYETLVRSGTPNVPGHTHQCSSCSTWWWH